MPYLLRRLAATLPVVALLVVPAHGEPVELMPGVTYEQEVRLTPHGPVRLTVITAPPPGGLTTIGPVLSGSTLTGPRLRVTQIERSLGTTAITAGIAGEATSKNGIPRGIVVASGVYQHGPAAGRSSLGFDANGTLHVTRFSFVGTWKGTGQRHPLAGINEKPKANRTVLFTPAWGPETPDVANATVVVLEPFPSAVPNTDLQATVAAAASGPTPIPPDGAVLVALGAEGPKLAAEAPEGTAVTTRLILPSSWAGVTSAIGGGPLLVRNHKAVFRTTENFTAGELMSRDARAGIGQLDDGRVVLVAVDGGRPGYSVGMTTYELAQTMVRLGAVTAAALEPGKAVTAAFQGKLLNRPSAAAGERPVREALLVQYLGVYAASPSIPQLGPNDASGGQQLSYTVVRPSTVTATLVAPDGSTRPVDSGAREPGTYRFGSTGFDIEGVWHWHVEATDDGGRQSTADRTFQVDATLTALKVPAVASALKVGFTLARAASVTLQIETKAGTVVARLPATPLEPGAQSLSWDDSTSTGANAPPGRYVARVVATSAVGTMNLSAPFVLRQPDRTSS
jgi:Phosphodiester glycosidase/FlgD Ig-like domain